MSSKTGYTKAQFMQSKQYKGVEKDILNIKLKDGEKYTHEQAKKVIEEFNQRKVAKK